MFPSHDLAGRGIRSGSLAVGGQYDLAGTMYSRVHKSTNATSHLITHASGTFGGTSTLSKAGFAHATGTDGKLLQFDPQITQRIEENGDRYHFLIFKTANLPDDIDLTAVKDISLYQTDKNANSNKAHLGLEPVSSLIQGGTGILNVRRLNQVGEWDSVNSVFTSNALVDKNAANSALLVVVSGSGLANHNYPQWIVTGKQSPIHQPGSNV